jgi:hypothetical protein
MIRNRVVVVGLMVACVGSLVTSSCATFDVPASTCSATRPSLMVGKEVSVGRADPSCAACFEDRCCDEVGRCQDQNSCASRVRATQACVVAAGLQGAGKERACTTNLAGDPLATKAYGCMRERCGEGCGLPVCQIDPATLLMVNAECDSCVSGACCPQINACYGNRTCKLMLECIFDECKRGLSSELEDPAIRGGAVPSSCQPAVAAAPTTFDIAGSCVAGCLARFAAVAQGPEIDPGGRAGCLAFDVYSCASRAGCSKDCRYVPPDASP